MTSRPLVCLSACMLAVPLLTASADAAPIAWTVGDVTGVSGVGDAAVSTNGSLVEAANFGGAAVPSPVINTVTFTGIDFVTPGSVPTNITGLTYNNSQSGNGESGIGTIDVMFDTIGFESQQNTQAASLTGLTINRVYEVQFFLSHVNTADRSQAIDDGQGNSIVMQNANPSQFVTGTFTANATTQDVGFDNLSVGSQLLSGYQLRDVTPIPEPGSLALLGLGGLLIARRRR